MNYIRFFVLFLPLLWGCQPHRPLHVPDFSTLYFTGNAMVSDVPMPLQGALTRRQGELKFVLAARQGVVLGYGTIDPGDGDVDILFSQSHGSKKLLESAGDALVGLIPELGKSHIAANGWTSDPNSHKIFYKNRILELSAYLDDAR